MVAKYEVFGAAWCSYCKMAVQLLEEAGLPYDYYDITEGDGLTQLEKRLNGEPFRTIPRVFLLDRLIGGYEDLKKELNHDE
jgi:glutaredoxin